MSEEMTEEEILAGGLDVSLSYLRRFGLAELKGTIVDYGNRHGKVLRVSYPKCIYNDIWMASKLKDGTTNVWEGMRWKKATEDEVLFVKSICFPDEW